MANTGIRQLTTVVGGYAKRIWYSLNGTTPINELMSIDDTGKLKCVSEQVTGLAGTGSRMVVADASGNLSAPLNNFKTTYTEGSVSGAESSTWVVLMECPVGRVEIAVTFHFESFAATALYYSQASFARATGGTPVTLYTANGGVIGTRIRLNGNNIEAMQTSGGTTGINYRYTVTSARY
jgi:hypothetical protein